MNDTQQANANIVLIKGGIQIEIINVLPSELVKLQDYFAQLINAQIHRMKNGSMILHFDNDGNLSDIDIKRKVWKRRKT